MLALFSIGTQRKGKKKTLCLSAGKPGGSACSKHEATLYNHMLMREIKPDLQVERQGSPSYRLSLDPGHDHALMLCAVIIIDE